jgi:ribosome maturation factor RimP
MNVERRNPDRLYTEIRSLVRGMGFELVEFVSQIVQKTRKFHAVIYRKEGVTIDDVGAVHKAIQARLSIVEDSRDIDLGVSSPGLSRILKYFDEFETFKGRGVKVYRNSSGSWVTGTIGDSTSDGFELIERDTIFIPFTDIGKAKLEDREEAR